VTVDRSTLVFFDASCIVAASASPNGGSGFVLSLCRRRLIRGAISDPVLEEVERNLASNFAPYVTGAYRRLMLTVPLTIATVIGEDATEFWSAYVGEKDAHVVAAAESVGATFLLTLDKGLAAGTGHSSRPIRALSPGEFINTHLVNHPERGRLRGDNDR
jgi:predicted nucleic acid-binding protein